MPGRAGREPDPVGLAAHPGSCFGCAPAPAGLGLVLALRGERLEGAYTFPEGSRGPAGSAHEGLVAAVLDEACAQLATLALGPTGAVRLDVRHLAPVPVGVPVRVETGLTEAVERRVVAEATILDGAGFLLAHARAERVPVRRLAR